MKKSAQLNRIEKYEAVFDELSSAAKDLSSAIERFDALKGKAKELETYYTGRLWKKDFADDESGLLPPDLKRGVLSEDGIYDLLVEISALEKRIGKKSKTERKAR